MRSQQICLLCPLWGWGGLPDWEWRALTESGEHWMRVESTEWEREALTESGEHWLGGGALTGRGEHSLGGALPESGEHWLGVESSEWEEDSVPCLFLTLVLSLPYPRFWDPGQPDAFPHAALFLTGFLCVQIPHFNRDTTHTTGASILLGEMPTLCFQTRPHACYWGY